MVLSKVILRRLSGDLAPIMAYKDPEAQKKANQDLHKRKMADPISRERIRAQGRKASLKYYNKRKGDPLFRKQWRERNRSNYWKDPEKSRRRVREQYYQYFEEHKLLWSEIFQENMTREIFLTISHNLSQKERLDLAEVMAAEINNRLLNPGCKRTPIRRNFDE